MSRAVVVFDVRQFVLVVVVRQSVAEFVEGKGGLELPTNTSSKTSADAARSVDSQESLTICICVRVRI